MNHEMLRIEGLCKSFSGVKALSQVSLAIKRGEVLCLVGENGSGKSTLIKIISGIYKPDEGTIYLNGAAYQKLTPIQSIKEGIQVIYQDFSLFPNLTVAENLAINEQLSSGKQLVNWRDIKKIAKNGLAEININIPLDLLVEKLSVADRQLIAIAKALMAKARLIIMDEPTTALTQKEIHSLFQVIRNLKRQGISILFVSHKLNEIAEIADRVIVFRNGQKVLDQNAKGLNVSTLAYYMTGHKVKAARTEVKKETHKENKHLLVVDGGSLKNELFNISFYLNHNEILGITGLLGSGRTELALALYGETPFDSGNVYIDGKIVKIRNIEDAIRNGIGYVPEDRIREGLFLEQSITNNLVVEIIDRLINMLHLIDEGAKKEESNKWISQMRIRTPSGELPAKSLSGGNQQRTVLAKWLATSPKILVLNGPTVGVDVGSKVEIHELIRDLAKKGMGILLITDDIPELLQVCDRILLMRKGQIQQEFNSRQIDEHILNSAMISSVK